MIENVSKREGKVIGLNKVIKLSHIETVRVEQNLEGE